MNIVVVGAGDVGLVVGTCLADSGHQVTCVDVDADRIAFLQQSHIKLNEPDLAVLIRANVNSHRLTFTVDLAESLSGAEIVFIAVGTPTNETGLADLTNVFAAAEACGPHLGPDCILALKSTVPVGTTAQIRQRLEQQLGRAVEVVCNPEFLKDGSAVEDFMRPDRIVVGTENQVVAEQLRKLYQPFLKAERPFLQMSAESAEMTKYVANGMLATKVSFINEMANLCELLDADINQVRRGIGYDPRIGFSFLFPGVGYGGSCFPQDLRTLQHTAFQAGYETVLLNAVQEMNEFQKQVLFEKMRKHFQANLQGKTIAIWGLAFKPKTDDIREAPSLKLISLLLEAGVRVSVHDPLALPNIKLEFGDAVACYEDQYAALGGADALAIVTEWNEYRNADFNLIRSSLSSPVIFDGRNLYDPARMLSLGIDYFGIGIPRPMDPSLKTPALRDGA